VDSQIRKVKKDLHAARDGTSGNATEVEAIAR
jgi:hypothetical protein